MPQALSYGLKTNKVATMRQLDEAGVAYSPDGRKWFLTAEALVAMSEVPSQDQSSASSNPRTTNS